MADQRMFERVKQTLMRSVPTRINSSAHTGSIGSSLREAARGYASVGVLVAFVGGVTTPAVLAGEDESLATPAQAASSVVLQDARTSAGSAQNALGAGSDAPTGGGAPAPRSDDPEQSSEAPEQSTDTAAEKSGGGGAPAAGGSADSAEPAAEQAPAAADKGGGKATPAAAKSTDKLDGWIKRAIDVMQSKGVAVSDEHADEIRTVIEKESSGDPRAINLWDSNAERGTPSKGLMQTIDPTFNQYKLPGYGQVYDPVDNIIAGVRYTLSRYGSFAEHPGLSAMSEGGGYQGY